ncbi:MAG: InlB B-repeat-containing protein [Ruminococcus sp.]|nr:InlB B-repeat-containing protein [Ruminococcus sp.]
MRLLKRITASAAAAAMAVTMIVPLNVFAEDEYTVVMHFDSFSSSYEPLIITAGEGDNLYYHLSDLSYDSDVNALAYPEPEGGKAIVGWTDTKDGTERYDLDSTVTKSFDLYPILADTVEAGTLALTVDAGVLPAVGEAIPSDISDKVTAPAGYKISYARYYKEGSETSFENDTFYYFEAKLVPEGGKTFDYSYTVKNEPVLSVEGATVNGSKANVKWRNTISGENAVTVSYPIALGSPETVNVTVHYNGHGNAADKTVAVPKAPAYYDIASFFFDQSAAELHPYDDDYAFIGWYSDAALTTSVTSDLGFVVFDKDTDIYAKWSKVIKEISFTIETPLCGDVVENTNGDDPEGEFRKTMLGFFNPEAMDNPVAGVAGDIVLSNEPEVECDAEGVKATSGWIETDIPFNELTAFTDVDVFFGTIYGENDYTFVINAQNDGTANAPYFAKDLKVTVNGTLAENGSGGAKPSTKAGIVSKATVVSKGGNKFTVVGMITADHVWDEGVITKEADCEEKGIKTYTCRSKDASYTDDVDAYGHKWLDWVVVKPATATEEGLEKRVCSNDGEHSETRAIPKLGEAPTPAPQDNTPLPVTGSAAPAAAAVTAIAALAAAMLMRKKK